MSRNAASVTTSGYLQTPLILLVGEHVDPTTSCAFCGSALGKVIIVVSCDPHFARGHAKSVQ